MKKSILPNSADLLDANVWLALAAEAHTHHKPAAEYWAGSAASRVAFCRVTHMAFLRLLTSRTVMGVHVLQPAAAWRKATEFLDLPEVELLAEPPGIDIPWSEFSASGGSSPNLWTDAYLAAFAKSGGMRLVTFDKGFTKFTGLDCLLLPH